MAEVAKGIIDIEINTGSAASQLQALQAQINSFNLALNKNNKAQGTFAGEYSRELQSAINKTGLFTAETVRLSTAAATLDKTLSKGKTSLGQFFSAKFNKNSAIAAETMALAAERARRLQTQFIATSGAANGFQDALAVRPLAAFSSQAAIAAQKTQLLSNMFKQGTTQLINFGKNVQWAGRQLMVGFTVPLTIFGATAGKTFMQLEKQVVSFKKVYGDLFTTPAEMEKNLQAVKDLASEYTKYGVAVKDTIGLAAEAAAAGRQGTELTDAVTQATRLATLGQMDQNSALETTISLQSAFKLSGQDLADTINFLNMVENQTVVTLQDIASAIPRVAPVIAGLGGDVKDLTVFLAAMQEGGVDANEGANALKSGLASLINPTKQATAMLSGFGINLDSIIQVNKGDLMGTVQAFAQALGSLDQFSRQQALEQVFGKFQYAKLGALFDNINRKGSQAQQVISTLGYTTEQLGATADKELKTIEESFGVQLTGAVERFKLAIAPIGEIFVKLAIPIVNFLTKIVNGFNNLSDGKKQFIAIAATIIGVVIPALTMMAGLFLNLVGTLAKLGQGMALFGKGFILGGPIGAVKALTQSSKYLSLAEMDAAMAAQQLSGASQVLNTTLIEQVGTANAAATAIANLTRSYSAMIATQRAAAGLPSFGVAAAAGANAASGTKASTVRVRGVRRNSGGGVPGVGNTDTVPAMLTPGEFVINKEATKQNLGLLKAINGGQSLNNQISSEGVQHFLFGGLVAKFLSRVMGKKYISGKAASQASSFGTSNSISKIPLTQKSMTDEEELAAILNANKFKSQVSSNLKTTTASSQKTHFSSANINSLEEFDKIVSSSSNLSEDLVKVKIAKELVKGGIPVNGLTDDWSNFLRSVNQASRRNTNTPMSISDVITSIEKNPSLVSIGKNTAFERVYPNITNEEFKTRIATSLADYAKKNGNANITDDILTNIRNDAFPRMQNAAKVTGIRIPTKGDLSSIIGASGPRDKNFNTLANTYFKNNNIPLEVSGSKQIYMLDKPGGKRTGIYNQFAGSTEFNSGGQVPGSGNTDTVPAMLTPGEFVINKKAASQNQGILEMMNGGNVKGYADGGLVGRAARVAPGALGFAGFMVGQEAAGKAGVDNQFAQLAGGLAAQSAATAVSKKALLRFGLITEEAAGKAGMLSKVLGKVGISSTKLIPVIGWIVTAGLTIKALNNSLIKAENAGGELSKAMYGSADRVRKMGEAFGRESFSTKAAKLSAERVAGPISEEAKQASSQYMGSESGKQLLADIELVKKQGGDAVKALRNQLGQSVIAGVITTDEAKAIAVDIGTAMNDRSIVLNTTADLNTLLGPNGENLLKDPLKILADITPKIDVKSISAQSSKAYQDLNPFQKITAIFKNQDLSGKDFEKQLSTKKISDENAIALENEAQARGLLNYEYQSGSITLEDYIGKLKGLQDLSNKAATLSGDAQANILGYKNAKEMSDAAIAYNSKDNEKKFATKGGVGTSKISQEGQNASNVFKQSEKNAKDFIDTLKLAPEITKKITTSLQDLSKTDPTIFDKFMSGQYQSQNLEFSLKMADSGISVKELDDMNMQLGILQNFPSVNKLIDINNKGLGTDDIKEVYDNYVAFDKNPDIFKTFSVKDDFSGPLKQAGVDWKAFSAMPNETKYAILTYVEVRSGITGDKTFSPNAVAESHGGQDMSALSKKIQDEFDAGAAAVEAFKSEFDSLGDGGSVQTLKEYLAEFIKLTKEKQKYLETTMQYLGTAKMEAVLLIDQQRYLEAIAMTESKTSKIRKEGKRILDELIKSAEDRLIVERATAFLSKSAEEKTLLSLDMQSKAIDANSEKQSKAQRELQRQSELNSRALDKLSEKENAVNKNYDDRITALDKVSKANDRIAQQESSRISLASALASGDIASAANISNEIQLQNTQNQIEDTKAALEAKKQEDLKNLTISINGELLTREQIETRNKALAESLIAIEDELYNIETNRLRITEQRAAAELRIYLLQQKQTIEALRAVKKPTADQRSSIERLMLDFQNLSGTPYSQYRNYGGKIAKMAFGGMAYKGSTEAPPALKMNNGSTVPGIGMTDKVPAMLTPGEFVVRKSVANQNRSFLEALNSQVFPGISGKQFPKNNFSSPSYSIPTSNVGSIPTSSTVVAPSSSVMYNDTYNVNVNVSGTNASPDDIANVVMAKLSNQNRGSLRSTRY